MRLIWLTARRDFRRRLRDWGSVLLWLGIPLTLGVVLVTLFGRSGSVQPRGLLLVADLDQSFASQFLAGAFRQGPMAEMFTVEAVAESDGRERMDDGEAAALLVIPEGFGEAALSGTAVTLRLVTNPSQQIMPGMAEGVLDVTADAAYYVRAYFPELADGLREALDRETGAIDVLRGIATLPEGVEGLDPALEQLQREFDRPRIALETEVLESAQPALNIGQLFFGSTLFMALFFTAQGMSEDYWEEHEEGTLRRVATTPNPFSAMVTGKLLVVVMMGLLVAAVAVAMAVLVFGVAMEAAPWALVWSAGTTVFLYLLMSALQVSASSRRMGRILSSTVMLPLLMLGGSFFPFEMMPEFLSNIGRWTPNGWALDKFRRITAGEMAANEIVLGLLVLGAWGMLFWALLRRTLRVRFLGV